MLITQTPVKHKSKKRGNKMFDTNKVANNIKAARTKMNMTQMNLEEIVQVAPLVKPDNIVTKAVEEESIDTKKVVGLAPFLSKETLKKIVGYMLSHGKEKHIIGIAPFMGKDMISDIVNSVSVKEDE